MIIFTENANITVWWNNHLIFRIKVNFLNCGRDITSISHNNSININGCQACYLCLWAPGAVSQTRCKLNCRNCPTNILNPVRFQVFEKEKNKFPSLFLIYRRECSQILLLFLLRSIIRTRCKPQKDESIFLLFTKTGQSMSCQSFCELIFPCFCRKFIFRPMWSILFPTIGSQMFCIFMSVIHYTSGV